MGRAQGAGITRLAEQLVDGVGRALDRVLIDGARQHDADRRGRPVLDALEERRAVDAGHPHVGDDDVEWAALELDQGGFTAGREDHVPAFAVAAQDAAETGEDRDIVVDEHDALLAHAACFCIGCWIGMRRKKVVPAPGSVSNVSAPWCLSTMTERAMARPCPVPRPTALVVKNGSKI